MVHSAGEGEKAGLIVHNPDVPMFSGPGPIKYTGNLQNAIRVLFGEGPLQNRDVLLTLNSLSQNIKGSIESLTSFV